MTRRPVRFAFCRTCRARERTILNGRCFICGQDPNIPSTETNSQTETKENQS